MVIMMASRSELRYQKRKRVLEAVLRGTPVPEVARVMGVPVRSIFEWLARYRVDGWEGLRERGRSGRPPKVTPAVMRWIYDKITMGSPRQLQMPFCLWTLNIVRSVLKEHLGVRLSKASVSYLLNHLGLSPQKPIYRSYTRDPQKIKEYINTRFPHLRKKARQMGAEIYFVDEAALRSDHHHGTTWAPVGETPEVQDSGQRFSLKLISAVSARGNLRFSVIEGNMNSKKFVDFLQKLRKDSGRPVIVIADGAGYHTSGEVKAYVEQNNGIELEHLPAYPPELNPDEQVWNHMKRRLSKLFFTSKAEMKRLAVSILRSMQKTKALIRSFFYLSTTRYAAPK